MAAPVTSSAAGDATEVHGSTSTLAATKPSNLVDGDLIIALCTSDETTGSQADFSATGFTAIYASIKGGTTAGASQRAFYKVASGEPSTWTFTRTNGGGNWGVIIVRVSHGSGTPEIDTYATNTSASSEGLTPDLNTSVNDCLILRTISWNQSKTLTAVPSGCTDVKHAINSSNDGDVSQETKATAGAVGAKVYDLSASAENATSTISIKPPSGGGGDLSVNVSDSITVTEAVVASEVTSVSVSESISVTDIPQYPDDTVFVSEKVQVQVQSGVATLLINVSDSVTITENVQTLETSYINVSESITVTENVKLLVESYINVSDSVTITENVLNGGAPNPNVSDNITITDTPVVAVPETVTVSESITVTESVKATLTNTLINVSDNVTISENVQLLETSYINVSDSITVTENALNGGAPNPNVSDSITVGEAIMVSVFEGVAVMDSVSVTENVALVVSDPQVTVSDQVTLTESIVFSTENYLSVADNITVTESVQTLKESYVNISDSVTVTESTNVASFLEVNVSEDITVSEDVDVFIPTLLINVSQHITVTESKKVKIETTDLEVIVSDTIGAQPYQWILIDGRIAIRLSGRLYTLI